MIASSVQPASSSWQRPHKLHRPLDPALQLVIFPDALRLDHDPSLHRLASDVEFLDVRLQQRILVTVRADTGNQRVLPDADEHVAVEKEADAAEHLFLFDVLLAG